MGSWQNTEISRIAASDDLHIAPLRDDGKTYGTLTWIWSVVVDSQLYARAYNGQNSRWYQAAIRQRAGRIKAAGKEIDVFFEPVDESINDQIDEAYRRKYARSSYLATMIGVRARAATIKITPKN